MEGKWKERRWLQLQKRNEGVVEEKPPAGREEPEGGK